MTGIATPALEAPGGSAALDESLHLRHRAALEVLRSGREVDGALLLSLVVWPTPLLRAATGTPVARDAT